MDDHLHIIVGIQLVKESVLSRCVGCGVAYIAYPYATDFAQG
ncbi:hypothetical protein [Streptococcus merionis]|uniref:Uncharacterized protein n=1 Tax=Streptococcus merionis TaxID=400065 RepID=A0A239SZL5_9STRE|nr:hypothetical protein [Streptococcus merionis]SNU90669.1 Uncharacterised protein [Streptococcus merionis]